MLESVLNNTGNRLKNNNLLIGICLSVMLSACGGGSEGGGGSPQNLVCANFQYQEDAQAAYRSGANQLDGDKDGVACEALPHRPATTTYFPLQSAYKTRIANGSLDNFTISGTCSGSSTISASKPQATVFESVSGFSTDQQITVNFSNCTPATNTTNGTAFFDTNYTPLGSSVPGVEYTKYSVTPTVLPASVKVGDAAVYETLYTYTDISKSVSTGTRSLSYVIESDSATTAIANFITKSYNTSNQLLFTQQSRYSIDTIGTLTIRSIDVQYSTTSTNHLIYTKN